MSGHGGNLRELAKRSGRKPEEILDFSANLNPLGPPEWLRPVVSRALDHVQAYPDPDAAPLVEAVAATLGLSPQCIVVGNGATELINALPRALTPKRIVINPPAYLDYEQAADRADIPIHAVNRDPGDEFQPDWDRLDDELAPGDIVFIGNPNNPTGNLCELARLRDVVAAHTDVTFVLDESFLAFVHYPPDLSQDLPANVVLVRSMTKFYAIPGLRLGYLVASAAIADAVRKQIPEWSVNSIAEAVGIRAIVDDDYATRTRDAVKQLREELCSNLKAIPQLAPCPAVANYVFCRMTCKLPASKLAERMLQKHGIAIRVCSNYRGLDDHCFRVAVRTRDENRRLIDALRIELGHRAQSRAERRTPAIMFQGTSSNAGKSLLTAAFCRILLQDGHRVAPFKAQNMSNNSFSSRDGDEIARAQVLQAQACRMEPDHRISPIILKPSSDVGSQVILRGKPVGNMRVREYNKFKPQAFAEVRNCYDSLCRDYDVIVLEGAGSPGEVNLKADDIVNMRMAAYAKSPVLLVGDIDRGGVFASFVGTMEVMADWERKLLAGFIVNKFRGDASLLQDAYDYVHSHTGRPVLGCVPFAHNHGLPEEDSVSFKSGMLHGAASRDDAVRIGVVDLPHISNFTDLDALVAEPDVDLRVIKLNGDLSELDAVILPGSKNTLDDTRTLNASPMRQHLLDYRGVIIGICGGFQMLGEAVADPHHIESEADTVPALGLLPMQTTMAAEKTLQQTQAIHQPSGLEVHGYEIHHGETKGDTLTQLFDGHPDLGLSNEDCSIWGSYLHGIFDADGFRRYFIDQLRIGRCLEPLGDLQTRYDLEPAIDRLAATVRQNLNLDAIYRIMQL